MPEGYTLIPMAPISTVSRAYDSFQCPEWIPRQYRLRPRQLLTLISALGFFGTLLLLWHWNGSSKYFLSGGSTWSADVENFDDIFLREAQLPQHNLSAPYPEGGDGRYVRFSNQVWGLG